MNESVIFQRIHNIAFVSTAGLMGIRVCLSHLVKLSPNRKYVLLTDPLSLLHLLLNSNSTYPLSQRIHLSVNTLSSISIATLFSYGFRDTSVYQITMPLTKLLSKPSPLEKLLTSPLYQQLITKVTIDLSSKVNGITMENINTTISSSISIKQIFTF